MFYLKDWWTCPKCRTPKTISNEARCARCDFCGRYFDIMSNKEIECSYYTSEYLHECGCGIDKETS